MDREEKKMAAQMARDAVDYERRKVQEERGRRYAAARARAAVRRNAQSPERPKVDPADLAAAAEAALGKPRPKAKAAPKAAPKASVEEVTAMATKKFGRPRAKAAVMKPKDTIRRVPVVKDAKRAGRIKGGRKAESAAAAVAAA
jgi:hypothetical protein